MNAYLEKPLQLAKAGLGQLGMIKEENEVLSGLGDSTVKGRNDSLEVPISGRSRQRAYPNGFACLAAEHSPLDRMPIREGSSTTKASALPPL